MLKRNQFLLFSLLLKLGKPVIYNDNIYTVIIYYSKHGVSEAAHFEMVYNPGYGKGMSAQSKSTSAASHVYDTPTVTNARQVNTCIIDYINIYIYIYIYIYI